MTSLPAPMFHALGYLHATIAMFLGSTLVLRRKFKPPLVLEDIEKHKVTAMVVVPVMLSRILDAIEKMDKKPDLSSLKIVFVSGSALGADLAERSLKDLGPVIYNMYGSTEIAFATIAEPKHLEFNSSTVGPVVKGVKVKIFDDNGKSCRKARSGGSSSATPSRSRATPAVARSRSSMGCCRRATWVTSTKTACSTSAGATTR